MRKCVKRVTECRKVDLQSKYLLADSELFDDVSYAIDRGGKGLHVISGGVALPIAAGNVKGFIRELATVWEHLKPERG